MRPGWSQNRFAILRCRCAAQGIAAESPQDLHWQIRGLAAESPVLLPGCGQQNAPIFIKVILRPGSQAADTS
jgi:hypothetical protein